MTDRKQLENRKARLTPEQKERYLERLREAKNHPGAQPIPRIDPGIPVPLSIGQERLWIVAQLNGADLVNSRPANFHIKGRLCTETFRRAFDEIVRRHSILRTRFPLAGGLPEQCIDPNLLIPLEVTDLTDVPEQRRSERVRHLAVDDARTPFDLARGPLLRARLLRIRDEEHLFLATFHHTIFDGWSERVFQRELNALYDAFLAGRPSPLPELKAQYADFACMQRNNLQGPNHERLLSYWRESLHQAPDVLELPTDRPRPGERLNEGEACSVLFPAMLRDELKKAGISEGATLYMTLFAAFNVLLHRYTGQTDLVIGSPVAGRRHIDTEPMIGLFINMLPVRSDLSGNPTFRQLLRRVRETVLRAFDHQDLPFEKLIGEIGPPRIVNHTPIFQIFFQLRNLPRPSRESGGIQLSAYKVPIGVSAFDLSVDLQEVDDGLSCRIEYDTALFDQSTIERMIGHFHSLLQGISADPDRSISALPLMTIDQRHELIQSWNSTRSETPGDATIPRLFREQVAGAPDRTAVFDRTITNSYRVLDEKSDQLASLLAARGIAAGTIVGILMNRSADLVAGILGVLKAGAAYLPLDPEYPGDRLRFMVEDSGVRVIVADSGMSLPDGLRGVTVLTMNEGEPDVAFRTSDAENLSGAADPMYVLYTSGSTGAPKGVLGTHRGALNRLYWMWRTYPFAAGEVCCQSTSANFVDSVWELFGPLLQGVPSVCIVEEDVRDPYRLVERLSAAGVTRIVVVPSLLTSLLATFDDLGDRLPLLRFWVSSGETLRPELVRRFHEAVPGGRLINLYGSSEVAADVAFFETSAEHNGTTVPVGRPIANTRLYVLDANGEPVPPGIPGELYVGGAGIAKGYLGREDLTSERFVADPFVSCPGERMFRTGDRVRWREEGELEFLGRTDRQVSLRGFRIELGEIEVLLRKEPVVQDAVVVMDGHAGFERLIAYTISRGTREDEGALRAALARQLPAYMIPSAFVYLDRFPSTPNGKLDHGALPRPAAAPPRAGKKSGDPVSELERVLAGIWAENLGLDRVGIHDNYFESGGHSLLAVRLFAAIEERLQVRLPLGSLFQAPTIVELAEIFPDTVGRQTWSLTELMREGGADAPLFLVHPRGGGLYWYRSLVSRITPSHPVYGIHPAGLDGRGACLTCVEDMAARYVGEVRRIQPTGPILLGGYSFGGTIAFEMARQFGSAGREVALLALFDTFGPDFWTRTSRLRSETCRLLYRTKEFCHRYRLRARGDRVNFVMDRVRTVLRRRGMNILTHFKAELPEAIQRVVDANVMAHRRYVPSSYDGTATLFVAKSRIFGMPRDPELGWSRVINGEIRIRYIDGDHLMLLDESLVQTLADQLNQELAEISAGLPEN